MEETKQTIEEAVEKSKVEVTPKQESEVTPTHIQENPLGISFNPEASVTLSIQEFGILTQFYKQFEMPLAILSNITNKALEEGTAKHYFLKDLKRDQNGQPIAQLNDDFWKPKVKSNGLQGNAMKVENGVLKEN